MIELNGKYNKTKIYTDTIEKSAIGQITTLLNTKCFENTEMRFMPDCHSGKGCTIGTVINIHDDKIWPGLIGPDINCAIMGTKIYPHKDKKINLEELDKVIHEYVPSGRNIFDHDNDEYDDPLDKIKANIDIKKARQSIGTLGGGNHFIELDIDNYGQYWLLIHTGSRYLGQQVYTYYHKLAWERMKDKAAGGSLKEQTKRLTEYYKSIGESKKLSKALSELKSKYKEAIPDVPYELAYLERQDAIDYLEDCKIVSRYAFHNRLTIMETICDKMKWGWDNYIDTPHNYIHNHILRKGAIASLELIDAIIPLNMRDGALLVRGKSNPDWLWSAPHGAGRLLSRKEAKDSISIKEYKDSMEGIYSSCISTDTIDESCFAYKDSTEIIANIKDTVDIINTLKPVYNFKAGGEND